MRFISHATIITGPTQAPSMLIGAKAAGLILAAA